jgi:3-phosphoshikimate 1-carboxyvinyltransferase
MSSAAGSREPPAIVQPFAKGRDAALAGAVACPADKSITHRSVMFAAMAKGRSRIERPLLGADCRSTMAAFRALGVAIDVGTADLAVDSPGWDGWQSPVVPLDFGNSGTTARLLTGVFAATEGLFVTCFGDGSLSKRPMGRVVDPLRRAGAAIVGRHGGHLLPLAISGQRLRPMHHTVDKATAQVKSALVLAGLAVDGETAVTLPAGGRDHTERMLTALGAKLSVATAKGEETIAVKGPFRPQAGTFRVPGDPSSAAFFAVLGALGGGRIEIAGVLENPTRTGFEVILERMGVRLSKSAPRLGNGLLEPEVDLTIAGGAPLMGVDMEPELAPSLIDEIPILAVCAMFARGESRFRGLGELRVKESDRLAKTIELVGAAGGKARAEGDDLIVSGGLSRARAFTYDPDEDHRLAMAAAVAAKYADGPCTVLDPSCVAVSFPGFFDVLGSM